MPDRYRAASPGQLAPSGVPQVLIIGGKDASFASFGRSYLALAKNAGETRISAVEIPEAGHFDVIAPTVPAWKIVIEALEGLFAQVA